jgi:predicted dehydrogenase
VGQLKAGIIGLGVGEQHIAGYDSHPDCEVIALCDFSSEKLAKARTKYPHVTVTTNADEILEDPGIDVVSIASYDNYHFEQIEKGIGNNKHVFVEKPLCLYEHEAVHIRELLRDKPDLKMSSNLILRMCPRFQLLKKMIESGELGELFYVEGDYNYGRLPKITQGWRGKIDFYSVVYGGTIHMIDLLLWLSHASVAEVSAYGNNIASKGSDFRHNDLVVSVLRFHNEMLGKVTANFGCVFPHFHALSVYGTKATFINGLEHGLLFETRYRDKGCQKISEDYPGVHKGALIYSFVESILNGSEALVTVEDIFKTMSVCFAIEKATRQTNPVTVKYL